MSEMVAVDHKLFKSRSNLGMLAAERQILAVSPQALRGYLLGLETSAAACRSHIISAAQKFGAKSTGVRVGRADLCCIEREIRRTRAMIENASFGA